MYCFDKYNHYSKYKNIGLPHQIVQLKFFRKYYFFRKRNYIFLFYSKFKIFKKLNLHNFNVYNSYLWKIKFIKFRSYL